MDTPQVLTKEQVADFLQEIQQKSFPQLKTSLLCVAITVVYIASFFMPLFIGVITLSFTMTMFIVVTHECAHLSLFRKRIVNVVIGHIAGIFCFMPFPTYQRGHRAHHNWVGSNLDKDPTPSPKEQVPPSLYLDVLFKLRIPVLYWYGVFFPYLFYDINPTANKRNVKHILQFTTSLVFTIVLHCLAARYVGTSHYLIVIGCGFFGSGIIYEHLFTMTQHLGLQSLPEDKERYSYREQVNFSRSVRLPASTLFFHFNLHKEHHLAPGLNYQYLPALHKKILSSRPDIFQFTSSEIHPFATRKKPVHEVLSAHKGDDVEV
ncbi:fatty acid desaturase family protein [Candidatus Uabimicrobium amorphum]|uniref:Fatty acid desaturase n=1 Tax=Uabimicrobium amorphum TaxID=2596890 RepID=A0A5S9F5R4_UABAM|nr:fatty acid desaturase [Candidatus Uabimicrobium amorphum]BBM85542.1 fatty acid desaturase [Candidatus Uabimicrobium amorphum]